MATLMGPENRPNLHCAGFVCDLCWTRFDTAKELAEHVEQEEWTLYPMPVRRVTLRGLFRRCCECGHWSFTARNHKGVCWGCRKVYGPV